MLILSAFKKDKRATTSWTFMFQALYLALIYSTSLSQEPLKIDIIISMFRIVELRFSEVKTVK